MRDESPLRRHKMGCRPAGCGYSPPMRNVRWLAVALAAWVLSGFGCGEDGGDDADDTAAQGGSGGSAAGTAGSQGLPAGNRVVANTSVPRDGECQSSSNCTGATGTPACATVAGGYRVCTFQPQPVSTASTSSLDECDINRACAVGSSCNSVLSFPTGQCGAAGAQTRNMCRKSTCASDADCPGGICGPTGFASEELISGGTIRQCIKADCKTSAECTAKAGGICALVQPGCVTSAQGAQSFYPAQLACVYPDGCTNKSNCPNTVGSTCKVVNGVGVCISR